MSKDVLQQVRVHTEYERHLPYASRCPPALRSAHLLDCVRQR